MTRKLVIDQPFDLALSLEMGQAFRWQRVGDEGVHDRAWGDPPDFWRKCGGWYSGVLEEHLIHIRQTDDGVEYRVGDEDGERADIDLTPVIHAYFRLEDDIEAIYTEVGRDPAVARAIKQYRGVRLLRQERWECLVSYLCSAQNSIRGIKSRVEKVERLGSRTVRLDGDERYVFPTAREVVEAGQLALKDLKLGLERDRWIFLMAERIAADPHMLDRLAEPRVPGPNAVRQLDKCPGVGPKIASCVALMSLDRLDAFPVDRWVRQALAECDLSAMSKYMTNLAEKVTGTGDLTESQQYKVAEWAREHFGDFTGYAGQYLFHWIEPRKR